MNRNIDWDLIAALYADHSLPLREIARRCGVHKGTISKRAFREGWPARGSRRRTPPQRAEYTVLIARMFRAIDRQMLEMEQRLETDPQQRNAAERERDARTLTTLTRTLEKLRDLQDKAARSRAETGAGDDGKEARDTEEMRAELERRFTRLLTAAGEAGVSGEPE